MDERDRKLLEGYSRLPAAGVREGEAFAEYLARTRRRLKVEQETARWSWLPRWIVPR